jgi:hypothetical protein
LFTDTLLSHVLAEVAPLTAAAGQKCPRINTPMTYGAPGRSTRPSVAATEPDVVVASANPRVPVSVKAGLRLSVTKTDSPLIGGKQNYSP